MTGTIVEFIFLLIAHAAAGIYSSTLKYSKKITYSIICSCTLKSEMAAELIQFEFKLTSHT